MKKRIKMHIISLSSPNAILSFSLGKGFTLEVKQMHFKVSITEKVITPLSFPKKVPSPCKCFSSFRAWYSYLSEGWQAQRTSKFHEKNLPRKESLIGSPTAKHVKTVISMPPGQKTNKNTSLLQHQNIWDLLEFANNILKDQLSLVCNWLLVVFYNTVYSLQSNSVECSFYMIWCFHIIWLQVLNQVR